MWIVILDYENSNLKYREKRIHFIVNIIHIRYRELKLIKKISNNQANQYKVTGI